MEFEWTADVSNDNAGRHASVTDRAKGDSTRQRSEMLACFGSCPLLPQGLCHFSHFIPLLRWWTDFGKLCVSNFSYCFFSPKGVYVCLSIELKNQIEKVTRYWATMDDY